MKKIAILTLNGYFNYGNRLQNYALQETLKAMGFEVETIIIVNKPKEDKKSTFLEKISTMIEKSPGEIFSKLEYKMWIKKNQIKIKRNEDEIKKSEEIRTSFFKKFTYKYIKETDFVISDNNIPEDLSDRYDYFITGSDQVWNTDYSYGSSIYFLTFAEQYKRIAYAPSFGVSKINSEYIENYKKWILGMRRLSVREDDGAKIIRELTGIEASVLIDPTLLLTKNKWISIANEAENKPKCKYLLTYFIGRVLNGYKKQINKIAHENNLKIINLSDIRELGTYTTGPSEFIDYINSCSILCTDSFHGTIFSILMEKPFIVYERINNSVSMFSRIDTLLDKIDLSSRKASNIKSNKDVFEIDFSHIPPILEAERNKAFDYLKESLNLPICSEETKAWESIK